MLNIVGNLWLKWLGIGVRSIEDYIRLV